jgi:hypothetical protein
VAFREVDAAAAALTGNTGPVKLLNENGQATEVFYRLVLLTIPVLGGLGVGTWLLVTGYWPGSVLIAATLVTTFFAVLRLIRTPTAANEADEDRG